MDAEDLARGLVAGVLVDTVEGRGRSMSRTAAVIGVLALIAVFVLDGAWRGLMVVIVLLALLAAAVTFLVRKVAVAAIHRIGTPGDFGEHRAAIDQAIDDADLPTGPIATAKFAWRLRKGAGAETDRLLAIVGRLRTELDTASGGPDPTDP